MSQPTIDERRAEIWAMDWNQLNSLLIELRGKIGSRIPEPDTNMVMGTARAEILAAEYPPTGDTQQHAQSHNSWEHG
jgi:hypothetical protein